MSTQLIIDTDMAFDDWLALAYLIQCSDVEIKAVTIAATGEAHPSAGVQSALRILSLKNVDVPVTHGQTKPLRGNHSFPIFVRWVMDVRIGISFPKAKTVRSNLSSKDLLINQIEGAGEKITLLALGPLTNIAEVLLERPALIDKIEMIYVMGGALKTAGNLREMLPRTENTYAEWNIYIDPHAAGVVVDSGVPITLIPLDVTNTIPLTEALLTQLAGLRSSAVGDFVYRVVRRVKRLGGKRPIFCWDVVAAVVAAHPETAVFETLKLRVVQEEGSEIGRVKEDESGHAVRICISVDQAAFETEFLTAMRA